MTEPISEEHQLRTLTLATEYLATVLELNQSPEDALPLDIRVGMANVYVDHVAETQGLPHEEVVRGLCIIIQSMCTEIRLDPRQLIANLRGFIAERNSE